MADVETALLRFGNEYTSISLSKIEGQNGTRMRIRCERTGDTLDLDAVELDAIASMDHAGLGKLVSAATEYDSANAAVGLPAPWEGTR